MSLDTSNLRTLGLFLVFTMIRRANFFHIVRVLHFAVTMQNISEQIKVILSRM